VKDWKAIIGAVAPSLAAALGGPLAGAAVQALSASLLGKPDGTDAELATAIATGGTDALVKIREADQAFAVRMRELDIDLERVNQGGIADARAREQKTGDSATPRTLAVLITMGFFGVLTFLLLHGVPAQGGEALLVMLGALGAAWGSVVTYYFGSSAGSAQKTEHLAAAAAKVQP